MTLQFDYVVANVTTALDALTGRLMCCLCFERFEEEDLAEDDDGKKWDVCKPCYEKELQ